MRVEDQMDAAVAEALASQNINESDGSRLKSPVQNVMRIVGKPKPSYNRVIESSPDKSAEEKSIHPSTIRNSHNNIRMESKDANMENDPPTMLRNGHESSKLISYQSEKADDPKTYQYKSQ